MAVSLKRAKEILESGGIKYSHEEVKEIKLFLEGLSRIEYEIYQEKVDEAESSNLY